MQVSATAPEEAYGPTVTGNPASWAARSMNILLQVVQNLDLSVYRFLNGFAGNWLADHLANFEENNNLAKGGLFLGMYAYLWFRIGPDQEERRRAILAILTGTLLALVVTR